MKVAYSHDIQTGGCGTAMLSSAFKNLVYVLGVIDDHIRKQFDSWCCCGIKCMLGDRGLRVGVD